ncbi:MAG: hypothetical protein K0B87_04160 [Candidatus Syntrophosphaera sp.]|nr:hypothetical protein [Candidatus Syntrophosphaera sp.]
MPNKNLLLLTVFMLLALALSAEIQNSRTAIGVHAGTQSSSGYAMRWMDGLNGLQLTVGAYTRGSDEIRFPTQYYDWDSWDESDSLITVKKNGREASGNMGLNYIRTIDEFRNGRFYVFAGGYYKYFQRKQYTQDYSLVTVSDTIYNDSYHYYIPVAGTEDSELKVQHRWAVGAGPGFELYLGKQFRLALELPITYNWKHDIAMWYIQGGIYYYFK